MFWSPFATAIIVPANMARQVGGGANMANFRRGLWQMVAVLTIAAGWAGECYGQANESNGLPKVAPRAIPLLPLPGAGRRVEVRTAAALIAAVEGAQDGDVILVATGDYRVGRPVKFDRVKNVTLRGLENDPAKVTLRGQGFANVVRGDDILRIGGCDGVTVAYLTFCDCHAYGLKVEAEH